MMENELTVLAESGAAALVTLMVSDSWKQVKERFRRLFSRAAAAGGEEDLEVRRAHLIAAHERGDKIAAGAIEAELRDRLLHLLRVDAAAAGELVRLSSTFTAGIGAVQNINTGNVRFGSVVQARNISGRHE